MKPGVRRSGSLDGTSGSFGHGFYVGEDSFGTRVGFIGGEISYASYVVSYPQRGLTIALLSNTAKPGNNLIQAVWEEIPVLTQ